MEKKISSNWKEILIIMGAYCAFLIGSSFATGQEMLQYFGSHGYLGIGGALIATFLFTWTAVSMIKWGYNNKDNDDSIYEFYCGKIVGTFFKWFVPTFLLGVIIMMIAGSGAIFTDYLGLNKYLGIGVMAIIILLTALLGLKRLVDVIGLIGPIIIVSLLIISIVSLFNSPNGLGNLNSTLTENDIPQAISYWWLSGILYTAATILSAAPFFAGMGRTADNQKIAHFGGLFGGLAIGAVIVMITFSLLLHLENIFSASAPIIVLAENIYMPLGIILSIIIFLGVYTTATPMMWMICSEIVDENNKWYKVLVIFVALLSVIGGSLIPFGQIVGFIYPYAGYFGIFFLITIAYKQITFSLSKNKAHIDEVHEIKEIA